MCDVKIKGKKDKLNVLYIDYSTCFYPITTRFLNQYLLYCNEKCNA